MSVDRLEVGGRQTGTINLAIVRTGAADSYSRSFGGFFSVYLM